MKEPRTELGKVLLLVTMPIRIVWWLAVATGKSLAVVVGTAWVDSRGGVRWR